MKSVGNAEDRLKVWLMLIIKRMVGLWQVYKTSKTSVFGLIIVTLFAVTAIAAPVLSPQDPARLIVGERFEAPNSRFPFGTDDLGRDLLSRVIYGARIAFQVGIFGAISSAILGIIIGSAAGYFGGRLDDLLMRVTEFFLIIPSFFLALVIASIFGSTIWIVIFIIAIVYWPSTARIVRAQFLSLKEQDFVKAARAIGSSNFTIVFSEILPNALAPVIVATSLQMASAILLEASLSFIGVGDPTVISWGRMLSESMMFLRRAWWMSVFPGVALSLLVMGLNMVGDGLNDALNPRLR